MLAKQLNENGLLPDSLTWLSDDLIRPYLGMIIEREIKIHFESRAVTFAHDQSIKFFEDDVANKRLNVTKNAPEGMYL